jgi:uncharacterized iron-regulated protein
MALSMEMFDRDVQTVMDEYLRGDIREKNFLKAALGAFSDVVLWAGYSLV